MNAPAPRSPGLPGTGTAQELRDQVLLIEDDPGDAYLVTELLADAAPDLHVVWARSLAEAAQRLSHTTDCVLLDLGLPDAVREPQGLGALHRVLALAPGAAVLVLTGYEDDERGAAAVLAGAQDYLVKGQVDAPLLARSIRYAVQRRRADESMRALHEAEIRQAENVRLERGLLAEEILQEPRTVSVHKHYRPGRQRALLGGDFYDVVETPDHMLHVVLGDVAGHGPDAAALGVCLRIAWRTLIFAGHPLDEVLPALSLVLEAERGSEEVFATVAMLEIPPSRDRGRLRLAGHPSPAVLKPTVHELVDHQAGPALGVLEGMRWPGTEVELGPEWTLMLFTDGLIEGLAGAGEGPPGHRERLGVDRMLALAAATELASQHGPRQLVDAVERLNQGPLLDDAAVLVLACPPRP